MNPSQAQLDYLRSLAQRAGETFVYPKTRWQASAEIDRLKGRRSSTRAERALDRREVATALAERPDDATRIRSGETTGYGASAEWAEIPWDDEELARYKLGSGERVLYLERDEDGSRIVDCPASGSGRLLVEEGPFDDRDELRRLIAVYVAKSKRRDAPAGEVDLDADGLPEPRELARYTLSTGERVIDGQRVDGIVRLTDRPADGRGASHLIARGLTRRSEMNRLVADYVARSHGLDRPAAVADYERERDAREARIRTRSEPVHA